MCIDEMREIPPVEDDMAFLDYLPWVSKVKVMLDEGAVLPTRGHEHDAGYDLYAPTNGTTGFLWMNDSLVIDTGVHMLIPVGFCGVIVSKSGMNVNHSVTSTGLIDSGYTGSIKVKLYNHGNERLKIEPGQKISQIVIMPCMTPELEVVGIFPQTERGDNGFGSTGV